jgi:hypothetical protein
LYVTLGIGLCFGEVDFALGKLTLP